MRAWALHLAPRLGSVARLYLPGSAIDARRRELLGAVVSGALDVGSLVGLHAAWLEVLGPAELDDVDDDFVVRTTGNHVRGGGTGSTRGRGRGRGRIRGGRATK